MTRRLSEAMWILERDSALINTNDTRHLLTCADDDGRVTIIRRACPILSEGLVDVTATSTRSGTSMGRLSACLWKCETTTHFGTLMRSKTTQAVLSRVEKRIEGSYKS